MDRNPDGHGYDPAFTGIIIMVDFTDESRCYGKDCPLAPTCARFEAKKTKNHFLWSPYNKDRKSCTAYKRRKDGV